MINCMQKGKPLPIYGDGLQQRDWLYVDDFCRAIILALNKGVTGEIYNVTDHQERTNLALIHDLKKYGGFETAQTTFVTDRLGHDRRYGMDNTKIKALGWQADVDFADGLKKTIEWYLERVKN